MPRATGGGSHMVVTVWYRRVVQVSNWEQCAELVALTTERFLHQRK